MVVPLTPLPTQIHTWHPQNYGAAPDDELDGEWLYCKRLTQAGERMLVWSGRTGAGIVAVVDFEGSVRPRTHGAKGNYEGWGTVTPLPRPLSAAEALAAPVVGEFFAGRSIQRPQALPGPVAAAVAELVGGFPSVASFEDDPPRFDLDGGEWGAAVLPPEVIVEEIVAGSRRVAREIGFPTVVKTQVTLANGKRPDLWCEDGVVGDAKNQVTATWGPAQLEGYIEQCDRQWPRPGGWRGVLVQGVPDMAPSALPMLEASRYRHRIEVWSVVRRSPISGHTIVRLFP